MTEYTSPSTLIDYNGCQFDSLLELRFALMIEDKCSFILHPLQIPTNQWESNIIHLLANTRFYTPDFLVRKRINNKAYLIEIKPNSKFTNDSNAQRNQRTAEDFIQLKKFDWEFKFIVEHDIRLSDEKEKLYRQLLSRKHKRYLNRSPIFNRIVGEAWKYNLPEQTGLSLTEKQYKKYVREGTLPNKQGFVDTYIINSDLRKSIQEERILKF